MEQLELKVRTWGGARAGAGRPKAKRRTTEPHVRRPVLKRRYPVHVVQRVCPALARLRRRAGYAAVRRALQQVLGRDDFRVVHVSIQQTHLHLIVEAEDERALGRGMQILLITAARGLNKAQGRARGTVFPQRYHATPIGTPRQARNEITYVLNNWRKHREDGIGTGAIDRFASGVYFDGWATDGVLRGPEGYESLPVRVPRTWLLSVGWRQHGLIGFAERPGR